MRALAIACLVGIFAVTGGADAKSRPKSRKAAPKKVASRSPLPVEVEEVILPRYAEPVVVQEIPLITEVDSLPEVSKILQKDAALKTPAPFTRAPRITFKRPPPAPRPETTSFIESLFTTPASATSLSALSAPPRRLVTVGGMDSPFGSFDWVDAFFGILFCFALARTLVLLARLYIREP